MPTRNDRKTDVPLTNLTVAALQEMSDFVMRAASPILSVTRRSDKYYVYPKGSMQRLDMRPRGPGERDHIADYELSDASYYCDRENVALAWDWADENDVDDMVKTEDDAADFLAQQGAIYGDTLFAAAAFGPAIWTTDWDGAVAEDYTSQEILHWSDASSDPQKDVRWLRGLVHGQCYRWPNVMVVGQQVDALLTVHPVVRDAIKHTEKTFQGKVGAQMAAFFGVDKYLVAAASQNTAKKGQTASMSRILTEQDVWCGYVNPRQGRRTYTALRTFAFQNGGMSPDGVWVRKYDDDSRTSTVNGLDVFWDVKVISPDAGFFIDGAIA